jgi:hypothetical protein
MATFTERVQILFDFAGLEGVSGKLGKLKSDFAQAETSMGKLKVAGKGVADFAVNTAGGIAGIATAAAGFAKKAVTDFENLALAADKTAQQMGTSVEDASRWMEVSDDLGVSIEAVAKASQRLNVEASKGTLAKYGIDAKNSNDRLIQTLSYLGGITDATQRAAVGQELLGKNYQALAPILAEFGGNAQKLRQALAAVSDAKVINEEEVAKAKQLRDAMDKLSDAGDDVALILGETLAPAIADVANMAGQAVDGINRLAAPLGGLSGLMEFAFAGLKNMADGFSTVTASSSSWLDRLKGLGQATLGSTPGIGKFIGDLLDVKDKTDQAASAAGNAVPEFDAFGNKISDVRDAASHMGPQLSEVADVNKKLADSAKETASALNDQLDAMYAMGDSTLNLSQAQNDWATTLTELPTKLKEAKDNLLEIQRIQDDAVGSAVNLAEAQQKIASEAAAASGATVSQAEALKTWNASMVTSAQQAKGPLRDAIMGYIATVNGIPKDVTTLIEALISDGKIADAQRVLDETSQARTVAMNADANTADAQKMLDATADEERTATIDSTANTKPADSQLEATKAKPRTATINSTADTKPAESQLEATRSKSRTSTIASVANTTPAESSLEATRSKSRTATINARANTGTAESDIQHVANRSYTAVINVIAKGIGSITSGIRGIAGAVPHSAAAAPSATTAAPMALGAPMALTTPMGATGSSFVAPRAIGGSVTNVVVNLPVGTSPERTAALINRYARRNGRGPGSVPRAS